MRPAERQSVLNLVHRTRQPLRASGTRGRGRLQDRRLSRIGVCGLAAHDDVEAIFGGSHSRCRLPTTLAVCTEARAGRGKVGVDCLEVSVCSVLTVLR